MVTQACAIKNRVERVKTDYGVSLIIKFCHPEDPEFSKYSQGFRLEYEHLENFNSRSIPGYYYVRYADRDNRLTSRFKDGFSFFDSYRPEDVIIVIEDIFCTHPSAVPLYDFICKNNVAGNVRSPHSRLSQNDVCIIAGNLASILLKLYDSGIVYLDLNPGNILVSGDYSIHLIDHTFCYYSDCNEILNYGLKCCGNITKRFLAYYYSQEIFLADELLTAAFAEFYTHLFFQSIDDYRENFSIADIKVTMQRRGYRDVTLFKKTFDAFEHIDSAVSGSLLPAFDIWFSHFDQVINTVQLL